MSFSSNVKQELCRLPISRRQEAAAELYEMCIRDRLKGQGIGGAAVSEKHAGFVVNRGGATTDDIRRTMELVQTRVLETSGVQLEPEVRIW